MNESANTTSHDGLDPPYEGSLLALSAGVQGSSWRMLGAAPSNPRARRYDLAMAEHSPKDKDVGALVVEVSTPPGGCSFSA